MKKRWSSIVLGLVVSVVALALLLRRDLTGVRDELLDARYWAVLPCMALSVVGLWLRGVRWRVLLNGRLALRHSFHILNVSYFINGVLPLRVGELARAVLAARTEPPVPVLTSLSTIVVERLLEGRRDGHAGPDHRRIGNGQGAFCPRHPPCEPPSALSFHPRELRCHAQRPA